MPYWMYRFIMDRFVGKLLAYGYKVEMRRGNSHEAQHCFEALRHGNSEECRWPDHCTLDAGRSAFQTDFQRARERSRAEEDLSGDS